MQPLLLILAAAVLAAYAWTQLAPQSVQSLLALFLRGAPPRRSGQVVPAVTAPAAPVTRRGATPGWGFSLSGALTWPRIQAQLGVWSRSTRAWLIVGTLALGWYAWAQFLLQNYAWSVMALWIGGLCGFLGLVAEPPSWRLSVPRREWLLFAGVMVVGIGLRLYRVNDVPFGLNHDAAYSGLLALKAMQTPSYIPWSPDPAAGETLFDYWIVGLIAVLGPVPLAIKGAAVIAGIATLIGMYLFTRRLFGPRTAAIATFLLATSGWHLIFSRVGWRMITLPLVETFAFYFMFRAFQTRKRGSFALAGALLAVQLNTYLAGRIIPVIAVVWALVELWRGSNRLELLRGYALAAVSFLFAGASILAFALTNPDAFGSRYNSVSIIPQLLAGNWAPLWQNLHDTIGLFTVRANGNDFFIDQPLLDPPARWLFVLGLVVAVWWSVRRSRRYAFVLFGLAMALLPGLISTAPNGNRGAGTMPFVYIIAALPLVALLDAMTVTSPATASREAPARRAMPSLDRLLSWLSAGTVALVLVVACVGTFNQYLGPNRTELWGFYPETTVVGRYIRQIDDRYDSYLTDNYPRDALTYVTYRPGDPLVGLDTGGYPNQAHYTWQGSNQQFLSDTARPGRGLAFFMFSGLPENVAMLGQLRARYRNAVAFTLIYRDDNITRPASLVVLVPPPGHDAHADVPSGAGPAQ